MFRLSRFPVLKATSFKIMQTNYFQSWAKLPLACINTATLLVETLFNKLLKCLILIFRELPKPGDWYSKLSNRSEISQTEQQHNSWFSCQITERSSYFWYQYSGFDTSRELMPIVSKPQGGTEKWLQDPFCGSAADTRLRTATAIVETYNMKTLTSKNPLRSAATAPHKWKRTLIGWTPRHSTHIMVNTENTSHVHRCALGGHKTTTLEAINISNVLRRCTVAMGETLFLWFSTLCGCLFVCTSAA